MMISEVWVKDLNTYRSIVITLIAVKFSFDKSIGGAGVPEAPKVILVGSALHAECMGTGQATVLK